MPKLRQGSFFPDWLLTHRRRAEQALVTVVATAHLLGVSTRRGGEARRAAGVKSLSRSQVSEMATHLDAQVSAFRERPLDAGPYTFLWIDALTVKREDGRVVNVHALIATGVNADGHREILGLDVASAEDGAGWLAFLRGLVARGLSGVQLVISDAHPGLVAAIGSALPGAAWQRCRTHWSCKESTWPCRGIGGGGGGVEEVGCAGEPDGRGVDVNPSWIRIGPTSRTTSPMVRLLTWNSSARMSWVQSCAGRALCEDSLGVGDLLLEYAAAGAG